MHSWDASAARPGGFLRSDGQSAARSAITASTVGFAREPRSPQRLARDVVVPPFSPVTSAPDHHPCHDATRIRAAN
jgi:hypothetical protein